MFPTTQVQYCTVQCSAGPTWSYTDPVVYVLLQLRRVSVLSHLILSIPCEPRSIFEGV
jgi:hypothetical protein